MKEEINEYNATGKVLDLYDWFAKYGIWIWIISFSLCCALVVWAIRTNT